MQGGVPDRTQEDAAVLGIVLEDDPRPVDFEVWPENWPALELFLRCQTQWRVGMNGVTGFDYAAVLSVLRLYEENEQHQSLFEDLQVMESAVLAAVSKERN